MARNHGLSCLAMVKESIRDAREAWTVETEARRGEKEGRVDRDVLAINDIAVILVIVKFTASSVDDGFRWIE